MRSRALDWTSKLHPPYVFQVVEAMVANVVDPTPKWQVKPRARMASLYELHQIEAGAKANQILLGEQVDTDRFAEKQAAFAKQVFITGMSVYKTYWDYQAANVRRQTVVQHPIDEYGTTVPRLATVEGRKVLRDDPTAEVVNVEDFIWHQAAVSIDKAQRIYHRVWYSFDDLKNLEAQGIYQNVDALKQSRSFSDTLASRPDEIYQANRTKDMIEVLECWQRTRDGITVTSIGNRNVVLRDEKPNPFWHGQFPFVVCTSVPDLFRVPGISEVELVSELQEMIWSFMNQRIDSTELINNAIVLIRDDVDSVDQFEWAPGAQWLVTDPQQVSLLQVNPAPAQISLQAEEQLKQDLQNIPGAAPSLLGQTDPQQQTATEVSVTTTLAQRRVSLKKQQFKWSASRVGEQWMALNQQFIREPRLVAIAGADGAAAFNEIRPEVIQGDYYLAVTSLDESLMRQERRAEAQAMLQVAMQAAPIFAAISQNNPAIPPLNVKAFMDRYLDSMDEQDKDQFYSAKPQPQITPAAQQGPPGGPQLGPGQETGGVTAPQAYDATSPSNATSLSPLAALQRQGAMAGGPNNH